MVPAGGTSPAGGLLKQRAQAKERSPSDRAAGKKICRRRTDAGRNTAVIWTEGKSAAHRAADFAGLCFGKFLL